MSLTISVELLTGGYDAADADDRESAEWPPHPARLFCALVASARSDGDRAALRWLESQPAPLVVAATDREVARRSSYVVVNSVSAKGGNQTYPGRTNGLRTRTRALPTSPTVSMVWSGDPRPEVVEALDAMARRVPYLGRSTGVALVGASAGADGSKDLEGADGRTVFEPCDLLDREVSMRVPYAGYLDQLDVQFAAGMPAWEVSRYQGYRARSSARPGRVDAMEQPIVPSVYTDLLAFRFAGLKPQAQLSVRLTEALRSAVLRVAGRDAPPVLHGHGADGRPHVAFLALPDVGHEHADGHLLGLAVAIPDLPVGEREAVLRAVLGLRREDRGGAIEVTLPGFGGVEVLYQPGLVRPWGGTEQRWRQGSDRWISVTPVVLDRYPKRPNQIEAEILACLDRVGLPEPIDVEISVEPLITGAARLRPNDLPAQSRGRLFRHIAVTFDRCVSGPVLVGAGRYLGVGLLAPVKERG